VKVIVERAMRDLQEAVCAGQLSAGLVAYGALADKVWRLWAAVARYRQGKAMIDEVIAAADALDAAVS
jgi:hypothetical protein